MTRKAGIVEIKTTSYEEVVFRSDSPPVRILYSHLRYTRFASPSRASAEACGVTTGLNRKTSNVGLRAGFGSLWVTCKRKGHTMRMFLSLEAKQPCGTTYRLGVRCLLDCVWSATVSQPFTRAILQRRHVCLQSALMTSSVSCPTHTSCSAVEGF
jgi:hypothetical protein